jgi:hypothetical protein
MNDEARKYLSEIGKRGGLSKSPAKSRAAKRNASLPRRGKKIREVDGPEGVAQEITKG